jgi:hypothetical protein
VGDGRAPSTLIVVPVLARPHRVQPLLDSIWETTRLPHRVLFVASEHDHDERRAIEATEADVLVVPDARGTYPCKINDAYRSSDEPLIFTAADDLLFHTGWLEAALAKMTDGVGVVGTNDLGNPRVIEGRHSTHSLVARSYCDQPGGSADLHETVLHEGYSHWFCDDELVQVAQLRGVYAHATDSHVEHLHPFFGKAPRDGTYAKGSERKRADARCFHRRSRIWTRWAA